MANAKRIKEELIKQLEEKGSNVECSLGLIEDYIWMFNQVKEMKKDIKINGIRIKSRSASGYETEKDNPSIKNIVMYNKQMLNILKQLGIDNSDYDYEDI